MLLPALNVNFLLFHGQEMMCIDILIFSFHHCNCKPSFLLPQRHNFKCESVSKPFFFYLNVITLSVKVFVSQSFLLPQRHNLKYESVLSWGVFSDPFQVTNLVALLIIKWLDSAKKKQISKTRCIALRTIDRWALYSSFNKNYQINTVKYQNIICQYLDLFIMD